MNVVLVEFIDEAKALIEEFDRGSTDKANTVIVGLTPEVRRFFKVRGIFSESTLDYFGSREHALVLDKSEEMVRFLEDNISIKDELGIEETYGNSFIIYVRIMIAYSLEMLEILDNVVRRYDINEIIAFTSNEFPVNYPRFNESERYLGIMLKRYSNAHNIKFRNIDMQSAPKPSVPASNWLEKLLTVPIVWNYSLVMRLYKDRKAVLIADFTYNIDFLVDEIKEKMPELSWILFRVRRKGIFAELIVSVIWLVSALIRKPIKMSAHKTSLNYAVPFWFFKQKLQSKKVSNDMQRTQDAVKTILSKFQNSFSYKEVSFSDLFLSKINAGILKHIQELKKDTLILHSLMKKVDPDFIISPLARDIFFALGDVAKILDIPALLISHASHIKPKNRLEEIEHDHLGRSLIKTAYSSVAVQSPHARDYVEHYKVKSEVVNTGPLLWGRSTKARKDIYEQLIGSYQDTRILLHAGTPKTWAGMRFYIYETLDEYLAATKDIIEATRDIDNMILVIQFRPWKGLSFKDFKAFLPESERVFFSVGTPFRDIISIADVMISFSSTTIEEALYNKIPVLLYGGEGRYMHLPAFEISGSGGMKRSACYHIPKKEFLHDTIKWVLNEHAGNKLTGQDLTGHVFRNDEKILLRDFIAEKIS